MSERWTFGDDPEGSTSHFYALQGRSEGDYTSYGSIALEASKILSGFGADKVKLASSVEDALEVIKNEDIQFAVLDVNLGRQTSLPAAKRLSELGTPFVLATGYGDVESILKDYPSAPVVQKPFSSDSLSNQVAKALSQGA